MNRASRPGALQRFEPQPGQLYSVDVVAYLAGVSRRSVLLYCKAELIRPTIDASHGGLWFDESAVRTIRLAELLRSVHGLNLSGLKIIFDLLGQLKDLREELRFYRGH